MAEKKKVVSIPLDTYEQLKALATFKDTSTAALVREVLSNYLEVNVADVEKALGFLAAQRNSLEELRKESAAE